MASPQTEGGYTKIANELYDALCKIRISGEARQVLDVIIRKTYGFNKKLDCIALSQFSLATGLSKVAVRKALNKLISMNLITQKGNDIAKEYGITKDYELWKPLPKKVTLPKKVRPFTKKGTNRYQKSAPQKTKETITKDIEPQAALIVELIHSFEEINPSVKVLYGMPPQRRAALRLIETHGLDRAKKAVAYVQANRDERFCPSITTPVQLEAKWAQLEDYGRKSKNKTTSRLIN